MRVLLYRGILSYYAFSLNARCNKINCKLSLLKAHNIIYLYGSVCIGTYRVYTYNSNNMRFDNTN